MPQSQSTEGIGKTRWVVPALVIVSVSAISLAVGLGVIGPMIQRRVETPPPALSVSGTTSALPSRFTAPPADVEIKERVPPPPKPKPVEPVSTDGLADPAGASPADAATRDSETTGPADSTAEKPSIQTTVTDAGADANADGSAADAGSGNGERSEPAHQNPAGNDTSRENGAPAAAEQPDQGPHRHKAHSRRVSPLEALPILNGDGAAPDDATPKTVIPPPPDASHSGHSYRVQVGRFDRPADAQRLRDELAKTGLVPQVVTTRREGVVVYRVQVGTFRQKENAQRQMDALKAQSYEPYLADEGR